MPTPLDRVWNVAICGSQGAEIIVGTSTQQIMAFQGSRMMELPGVKGDGFSMLGCETQLIVFDQEKGNILVFRVGIDPLLTHCLTVTIPCQNCGCPKWTSIANQFSFVSRNQENQSIIHVMTSEIQTVTAIHANDLNILNCAVGERFIAVCDERKKIHIFELASAQKLYSSLCDVDDADQLDDEEELYYPLSLEPVGDLLVSTSHLGHALCIWNMKSGHLLKRFTNAFDHRKSITLPEGRDVTSMVRLKKLPAFVTMAYWSAFVWAFPDNTQHRKMISSIHRREKWNYGRDFDAEESDDQDSSSFTIV